MKRKLLVTVRFALLYLALSYLIDGNDMNVPKTVIFATIIGFVYALAEKSIKLLQKRLFDRIFKHPEKSED